MGRKKDKDLKGNTQINNEQAHNFKRLGEKLSTLRKLHSLTQTQLAHALGYATHSTIAEVEKGLKLPSLETVLAISRFFGVTTDQLLKDELELEKDDTNRTLGLSSTQLNKETKSKQTEKSNRQGWNEQNAEQ